MKSEEGGALQAAAPLLADLTAAEEYGMMRKIVGGGTSVPAAADGRVEKT